jgi:hypothetical protein
MRCRPTHVERDPGAFGRRKRREPVRLERRPGFGICAVRTAGTVRTLRTNRRRRTMARLRRKRGQWVTNEGSGWRGLWEYGYRGGEDSARERGML